jgi:hypothetical protein
MSNSGSAASVQRIVNVNEYVYEIKEGQIKSHVWDDTTSGWVKQTTDFPDGDTRATWQGKRWRAGVLISNLGNTSSRDFLIMTSNDTTHLKIECVNLFDCQLQLYETPTVTSNGVAMTAVNTNRMSGIATTNSFYTSSVIAATGTELGQVYIPQYIGWNPVTPEYILKHGDKYLVRATSVAASNNIQIIFRTYITP